MDWRSIDYSLVDEAAFFASTYAIEPSDDLVLPTAKVGYRRSQVSLPSDETIAAVAPAIGIDVPVQRHADIPDDPDSEPHQTSRTRKPSTHRPASG